MFNDLLRKYGVVESRIRHVSVESIVRVGVHEKSYPSVMGAQKSERDQLIVMPHVGSPTWRTAAAPARTWLKRRAGLAPALTNGFAAIFSILRHEATTDKINNSDFASMISPTILW